MAKDHVFLSILLAAGTLLIAACASQPTSSLDDKYFQAEAKKYEKFQHEGQVVYCTSEGGNSTLIPYTGAGKRQCVSESQLRLAVENYRRSRNRVASPLMPGAGQTGFGGG